MIPELLSEFHRGMIYGLFIGAWIGLFVAGLLQCAKDDKSVCEVCAKKHREFNCLYD